MRRAEIGAFTLQRDVSWQVTMLIPDRKLDEANRRPRLERGAGPQRWFTTCTRRSCIALEIDHTKLTDQFQGGYFRLTDPHSG